MPQEPIQQGAEEQIVGVSVHQVAEEGRLSASHASRHLAALSRGLNAPEPPRKEVLEMPKTVSHDRIQQRCVERLESGTLSDASQRPPRTWVPRGLLRS